VVDGARVSASDLGNNFFLDQSHLGRPRAECVTALLQELNEHVRGSYVVEDVASLLATNPGFLDDFTFVIATQLPEPALCALAAACVERSLPLIALRAYGMVGTVRVAAGEHVLVEGHPDNTPTDLRVCAPFAELRAYAAAKFGHDLGALSSSERKHVPFLILLLHATERYKGAHGGSLPASYKDKQALKASLGALAEEWFGAAGAHNALNFEEARLAVNTALQLPQLPAETRKVLEAAEGKLRALRPAPPPDAVPSPKPRDFAAHRCARAAAGGSSRPEATPPPAGRTRLAGGPAAAR
jgi:amyloid beta precursor protein binding protein 1